MVVGRDYEILYRLQLTEFKDTYLEKVMDFLTSKIRTKMLILLLNVNYRLTVFRWMYLYCL